MVSLSSIDGRSLAVDLGQPASALADTLFTGRQLDQRGRLIGLQEDRFDQSLINQGLVQEQAGIALQPGASQSKRDKALATISAINPQAANAITRVIQVGDQRELAALEQERLKGVQQAGFIKSGKTHGDRIARINRLAQEQIAKGGQIDEFLRLIDMPADQLELELDKKIFLGKTMEQLTKPEEPKLPETREVKVGEEVVTQQLNPTTGQLETVAVAPRFEPERPKAPTPPLSPERFEQAKEIASTKAKADIDKAIEVHKATEAFDAKTPAGQLKQKILEGKAAQVEINQNKQLMRQQAREAKANLLEGKIEEAKSLVDQWFTTGFMGQMLSAIGGTDARNLRSVIDTIQANLGFAELQAMRDASPTGGALGQVAVRELDLLQATVASLDQGLDDETLIKNLEQIRTHIQNWKGAVDQSDQALPEPTAQERFDKAQQDLKQLSNEELLKRF